MKLSDITGNAYTAGGSRLLRAALALLALAAATAGRADWNHGEENIATHRTWIYQPAAAMAGGKRGLMVVLHGCDQTSAELKDYGNLTAAADAAGLVLALPYVGANDQWGPGCWDYDHASDGHQHVAEIVDLTRRLMGREDLHIDPDQVYAVGLSSGAALALLLGCAAPDLYAGVASIAGPSVGSAQSQATMPGIAISGQNAADAEATCRSLAKDKSRFFATQIASLAYGSMDRDGADARYDPCPLCAKHPGQYRVVSVRWSQDNAMVLKDIYGADSFGNDRSIQNGMAVEQTAGRDGAVRVGLVAIRQVGHAWPAGTGRANGEGGNWIAQQGLNYPAYITDWLIRNNRRAVRQP